MGAIEGVGKAAQEWPEGTEFYLAGVDEQLDKKGYIVPGLGDVGDRYVSIFNCSSLGDRTPKIIWLVTVLTLYTSRLFLTIGK